MEESIILSETQRKGEFPSTPTNSIRLLKLNHSPLARSNDSSPRSRLSICTKSHSSGNVHGQMKGVGAMRWWRETIHDSRFRLIIGAEPRAGSTGSRATLRCLPRNVRRERNPVARYTCRRTGSRRLLSWDRRVRNRSRAVGA